MPTNAERLYDSLRTARAIRALITQAEDGDFECKEWSPLQSARESIAKAACGFTNATGGVIVVGMKTKRGSTGADVVDQEVPVNDVEDVRSQILDAISKIVEPGIEGFQSRAVPLTTRPKSKKGFVVVFVPATDGPPQRSRATKEFYWRIGPQTLPMEYFQIEDRFGRRPHPRLVVNIKHDQIRPLPLQPNTRQRILTVTVTNVGRGIARFPCLRYSKLQGISLPNLTYDEPPMWPSSEAKPGWISFRGSANDVVYPEESLVVTKLFQYKHPLTSQTFPALTIIVEAVCDGMPLHRRLLNIEAISEQPGDFIIGSHPAVPQASGQTS